MIGESLGSYRILSKIGQGGMGIVYRAHDDVLNRDVALKVLAEGASGSESSRDHILHEARASSGLSHPNICTIHQVGEFAGEHYIVMELVQGKTLSELIGSTGLAAESVMNYGVQIAAGLAHAHDRGIVHRDLKSSNIIVTAEGLVKILDFGLARRMPDAMLNEATATFGSFTGAGPLSGTLSYMAPEVLRGQDADARTDLWALGVVLFEAASAQLPFQGRTGFEISSAILHDIPAQSPRPRSTELMVGHSTLPSEGTGATLPARE